MIAPPSRPPTGPRSGARALRVLIVSDEADLAATWLRFLRLVGHPDCSLSALGEALTAVTRESPDVVLLDLARPPGLAGLDLLRQIRRRVGRAPLLLSGPQPSEAYQRQALAAGVTEWLAKPLSLVELRQAVERAAQDTPVAASGGTSG